MSVNQDNIRNEVHDFIRENFVFSDKKVITGNESLLGSGVLDSTGVLELISFLEIKFDVKFNDHELVAANFDTINSIISIVLEKLSVLV